MYSITVRAHEEFKSLALELFLSEGINKWVSPEVRYLPVPEADIQAFYITINSPLLQSALSR